MPVTFNSNNNYSVDIISELHPNTPNLHTAIEYSSLTNTPFVTVKITPTNPQTNPVLASNLKFDDQVPDFAWNGSTQQPPACEPPRPSLRSWAYRCGTVRRPVLRQRLGP